jgi:hypothetical protein
MKKQGYNLSNHHLTTCDVGKIIPISCFDVLPGDIVQHNTEALVRTTPLLAPVMHPLMVTFHTYFVPNRILWNDPGNSSFEDFITGGDDGLDASVHPHYNLNGRSIAATDLVCRLGMSPPADYVASNKNVNALPLRAYQMICREEYIDPDLSTEPTIDLTDGEDTTTTTDLQSVCYGKDQFTTARPWEHRGDDVSIDLAGSASLNSGHIAADGTPPTFAAAGGAARNMYQSSGTVTNQWNSTATATGVANWVDPHLDLNDLTVNLSSTGITFEDFMLAKAQWEYQRNQGKYGADYQDFIKRWGVKRLDARFQKPEYLGGGSQVIQFSEVLSTDSTNTGSLYGHGLGYIGQRRFRRFIPEHGWVMTLMFIRPMHIQTNGIHRSMLRETKFDYYNPEFLNIGDQAIKKQEVYAETADWDGTFGYNQRFYEYRDIPNRVTGEMLTIYDHYHAARDFAAEPSLNDAYVKVGAGDFDRSLASSTNDGFLIHARNNTKMLRPVLRLV